MSSILKVFPASLGTDWGRVLTEQNIKSILGFLQTKATDTYTNAVIEGFDVTDFGDSNHKISINKGSAVFEGYQIEGLSNTYSNIYYPANTYSTGTYYICLHIKITTGNDAIANFVETTDYDDFGRDTTIPLTSPTQIGGGDIPFIIVKASTDTDFQTWDNNVPDDLGLTSPIEEGYVYKYLPLYRVTITGSPTTITDSDFITIVDLRQRTFIPVHDITLGYLDDTVSNYFGRNEDEKTQDWRKKYILSEGGSLLGLEELLYNYISFINNTIRGYGDFSSVTTSNTAKWNTVTSNNTVGTCLPIQNLSSPNDSIIGHLKYNYSTSVSSSIVPEAYINENIVTPTIVSGVYTYPTEGTNYDSNYLVTLNENNQVDYKFLPLGNDTTPGIIQVDTSYKADASSPSSSNIFTLTDDTTTLSSKGITYKKLSSNAARYSISQIVLGSATNTIDVPTNNTKLTITSGKNTNNQDIFGFATSDSETYNEVGFTLSIANPVDYAYYIKNSGNNYTIGQNLLTNSDVTFNSVTAGSISVDSISPKTSNGTITFGNNVEISGTLTATKVYNAVYNDYAELFEKLDKEESFEVGDIICIDKNGKGYTKSYEHNSSNVVGVYSTSYGVILGGEEDVSLEENLKTYIPIGISGRVPVKVIGQAHIGDLITSSEIQGVGRVQNSALHGTIIGKCLENKETDDIGLVKILIMLS